MTQPDPRRAVHTPRRATARPAVVALLASAAIAAHCGGARPPTHVIREPSTMLEVLRRRETRVRSLRARGSAEHYGRQGRVRGSVVIFVERPDKMRVDTFAFGNLVSSMVSDGRRFSLLQGTQYFEGPARPCVAAQLLGIPMEAREVVAVLSGGAPLLSERLRAPRWEDGRYVVEVEGEAGAHERIELEVPDEQRELPPARQQLRVRRVVLRDREGLRAEITYQNYRTVDGTPFPDRVRVVMPRDNVDTMLRFDEVTPNFTIPPDPDDPEAPPPDPFSQRPPAGVTVTPIGC